MLADVQTTHKLKTNAILDANWMKSQQPKDVLLRHLRQYSLPLSLD